jgi:hypothetical protein
MPRCNTIEQCPELDERLVSARQPLFKCIATEAHAGRLDKAHRCYRALRLIESARWWLRTLTADRGELPSVYRTPVETFRNEFFCRIERLSTAAQPELIEQRYLDVIQAFP